MLRGLTDAEVDYYHQHLPRIEARNHYGVAQLNADFREMFFPRFTAPDPDAKAPEKPPRPRKPWTVDELLPPFAWFEEPTRLNLTQETASSLVAVFGRLPKWAQALAPIDAANATLDA